MAGVTEERVDAVASAFHGAALGEVGWSDALEGLAELTGSTGGQLIGLGSNAVVPFNMMTGVPEETSANFVAVGGGDPAINSRVRIGAKARELEVLDESAFTTEADMRRNYEYARWIETYDMHNACLTTLVKQSNELVGLSLIRSKRQGNVSGEQRRIFAKVAPHVRAAVRTRLALEEQGAHLLAGAFDAVRAAVLICDGAGRIRAMSNKASELLSNGELFGYRDHVLVPYCDSDRRLFEAALNAVIHQGAPEAAVALKRRGSDENVYVEIAPLPRTEGDIGFGLRALVTIRQPSMELDRVSRAAQLLYHLTASEAQVAAKLAAGEAPAVVARTRGVSSETIKSQVRRIYEKTGATSQLELSARILRL